MNLCDHKRPLREPCWECWLSAREALGCKFAPVIREVVATLRSGHAVQLAMTGERLVVTDTKWPGDAFVMDAQQRCEQCKADGAVFCSNCVERVCPPSGDDLVDDEAASDDE